MQRIAIATALLMIPASLCAQWLALPTPGIPRTADGKPNLTAPAPRMPDGKPDLSGTWQPEANPYRFNLIQQLKDESYLSAGRAGCLLGTRRGFQAGRSRDELPAGRSVGNAECRRTGSCSPRRSWRCFTRVPLGVTGRSTWMGDNCRTIRTRLGWGTQSAAGRATRWWSSPQDSMIGLGSTGPVILIRKSCASPRDSGASISDTCSIRSRSTIRRH